MIRPRPARWFEALVARDDCTLLLEALGASGAVELEARAGAALPAAFIAVRPELQRFFEYRTRYAAWWPTRELVATAVPEPPAATLERGLAALDAWAVDAEPAIRALERNAAERAERLLWRELIEALADSGLDLGALAHAGPLARAAVIEHAGDAQADKPGPLLARPIVSQDARYMIIVGSAAQIEAAARDAAATKGRAHPVPPWLTGNPMADQAAIGARLAELDADDRQWHACSSNRIGGTACNRALADLYAPAVGDRAREALEVRAIASPGSPAGRATGGRDPRRRRGPLAARARSCTSRRPPAAFHERRSSSSNPRWARPFELFPRALGVPGRHRGRSHGGARARGAAHLRLHVRRRGPGALIAAAGWWLRKRTPVARFFVAGGVAAAASSDGSSAACSASTARSRRSGPIRSTRPSTVLIVPICRGRGAARGRARAACDGLALARRVRALLRRGPGPSRALRRHPRALRAAGFQWLALAGAAAFVTGHAMHAGRLRALGSGLGELVERTLQLLINTLSFARVGAFALAHAGLSSAVVALMAEADNVVAARAHPGARQRPHHRARGDGGVDPDHAPGAVRVLRPLPHRRRAARSARCRPRPSSSTGDP